MFALDGTISMDENYIYQYLGFENLFQTTSTFCCPQEYASYLENYPPALIIKNMESGGDSFEVSQRVQQHSNIVEALDHSADVGKKRHISGPTLFAPRSKRSYQKHQVQVQVPGQYLAKKPGGIYERGSAAISNLLVQI